MKGIKELGTPKTVGDFKKILSKYNNKTPLGIIDKDPASDGVSILILENLVSVSVHELKYSTDKLADAIFIECPYPRLIKTLRIIRALLTIESQVQNGCYIKMINDCLRDVPGANSGISI
jgi:hypothetical protein